MLLSHVDSLGFHFTNNGKFIKQQQYLNTHLIANSLVQIKPTIGFYNLYLMKANTTQTDNKDWLKNNEYRYLSSAIQLQFSNSNQKPSAVNNKVLKVFMLNTSIAEKFLTTNHLTVSEREYKDISSLIKSCYFKEFRYEFNYKTIELPNQVPMKQVNNLVKVGNSLVPKPVRRIAV